MKNTNWILFFCFLASFPVLAQPQASIKETNKVMKTYMFSDPNPVANPDNLYYPYFRFDGYADKGQEKSWKVIEMENDYIKVSIFPEIGGKIWGAVEKSTGSDFIYFNHVVKFRDIAMRGPWTSGGIEYNFGIIGHAPTSSTPVDYECRSNEDGSVSCFISALELITHTRWSVEINLPKDKAYFTTTTTWYNSSSVQQPYYHWMNAAYKAEGNLEFCYPGQYYIGHGGDKHLWPYDEERRNIAWYEKNDFGGAKSYHVIGKYNDYYGAYWHKKDVGSVHYAPYDEKLGMKIFLWGMARSGAIWENLLTDTDGQYVELQSGRMYNQPATGSAYTPYKHFSFSPQATDVWTEYWFPVKGTQGIAKVSPAGVLNVVKDSKQAVLYFCPLQKMETSIIVSAGGKEIYKKKIALDVFDVWKDSLVLKDIKEPLEIVIGDNQLVYNENSKNSDLNRPTQLPDDFKWDSLYGLYTQGEQFLNQNMYNEAEEYLKKTVEKDPYFLPALNKLGLLYYQQGNYKEALNRIRTSLSLNTYDGEANYMYGLINRKLSNRVDAKDGFSIASYSPSYRSAAYANLAQCYLEEKDWNKVIRYAEKSLKCDPNNQDAKFCIIVAYRKSGHTDKASGCISQILKETPLNHWARFESYLLNPSAEALESFKGKIKNELPHETYMELAEWYEASGCREEAMKLYAIIANYPIALYRYAYLLHLQGMDNKAGELVDKAENLSPEYVFPFCPGSLAALEWCSSIRPSWKLSYYMALLHWHSGRREEALTLLNQCEDATYAPVFLSRAMLQTGKKKEDDLKKAEKLSPDWRTGMALIKYYQQTSNKKQALSTAEKYHKKYPANYMIALKYAKALCDKGDYKKCLSLLEKTKVLPNEGAYEGRSVYRDANLYQAIAYLSKKKYNAARLSLEKSKIWIENLGVGKPFDSDIDSRLEDFIDAYIYEKQGLNDKAVSLYKKVADNSRNKENVFNSNTFLAIKALQKLGKQSEAEEMMGYWAKKHPESKIIQWCCAIYKEDRDKAEKLIQERNNIKESTPWENVRNDYNFNVIVAFFQWE